MTTNAPGAVGQEPSSGYERLEQQIAWYDTKSRQAQNYYKGIKSFEFVLGAAIPIGALTLPELAVATIGAVAVVLAGIQQMNQWQHNWITYRSTCESLRHEKYSFLGGIGAYEEQSEEEARKLLVERVEGLISTEHSKWLSFQSTDSSKGKKGAR